MFYKSFDFCQKWSKNSPKMAQIIFQMIFLLSGHKIQIKYGLAKKLKSSQELNLQMDRYKIQKLKNYNFFLKNRY